MQFGPWDVQIVSGGTFRLDGGAMFGTVPKVVWSKIYPADEENQILMATNCLLIRGEVDGKRHVILVDNGNGDKETDDFMARFKFEGRGVLDANLARHGVKPADITLCILTHLHFDHAGGSTRFDGDGKVVPSFPNARYVVQARDLADAKHPHLRVKASYLPQNWEPLEAAGRGERAVEHPREPLAQPRDVHLEPPERLHRALGAPLLPGADDGVHEPRQPRDGVEVQDVRVLVHDEPVQPVVVIVEHAGAVGRGEVEADEVVGQDGRRAVGAVVQRLMQPLDARFEAIGSHAQCIDFVDEGTNLGAGGQDATLLLQIFTEVEPEGGQCVDPEAGNATHGLADLMANLRKTLWEDS